MKNCDFSAYPIAEVIPDVIRVLNSNQYAVLSSPTGSGKTTVLPLALLDEPWLKNRKILMLEPRRIAAYAAANQLARNLNCDVGSIVGYRMRLDSKVSDATRLEVVTEGMLTRKLQSDPELSDVGLIIFDEFHERSLQADLALALALDTAGSLRDDLRILIMSATLDSAMIAKKLNNAPVIESQGRSYPVDIRYLPRRSDLTLSENTANAVCEAFAAESGSMLVFLPGEADIKNCEDILKRRITSPDADIIPLYGRLDNTLQRRAIEPAAQGRRKIVLATAIAESSITIDGVRVVVDSGFTKIAVNNPQTNLEHLETIAVSQAGAIQRTGRAGRTEPGIAYRLWSEHEQNRREITRRSEISYADLTGMMLELAAWGVSDPGKLMFADPPPEASRMAAVKYLQSIRAIDENLKITAHGKLIHQSGLSVRSGHLIAVGQELGVVQSAIKIAALLDAVDMRRNVYSNIADMLTVMEHNKEFSAARRLAESVCRRLKKQVDPIDKSNISAGALLACAYPERVARRRGAMGELRYLLSGGRAAAWRDMVNIAGNEFIVAVVMDDRSDNAILQLAAGVEAWEIEEFLQDKFTQQITLKIDPQDLSISATAERNLGAIVWRSSRAESPDRAVLCAELAKVIAKESLSVLHLPEAVKKLQSKLEMVQRLVPESNIKLLDEDYIYTHLEEILYSCLPEKFSKNMLKNIDWYNVIYNLLDYREQRQLAALFPEKIRLSNNREFKIDYTTDPPSVSAKLQLFFGVYQQPALLNGKLPLTVVLLSPAGRPVQTTSDIKNFWSGSYKLVRNELRGRYPKHDWPENP